MKISSSINYLFQPLGSIVNKCKIENSSYISKIVDAIALETIANLILIIVNKVKNYSSKFIQKIPDFFRKSNNELLEINNNLRREMSKLEEDNNALSAINNNFFREMSRLTEFNRELLITNSGLRLRLQDFQQQIHLISGHQDLQRQIHFRLRFQNLQSEPHHLQTINYQRPHRNY